jgi:hypothetical protein
VTSPCPSARSIGGSPGAWPTAPRPSVCRVLEAEFGYPVAELLAPDARRGRIGRDPVTALTPPPVGASQDEWRSVRRFLNGHRAQLADVAAYLYQPEMRIPDTSLLARHDWMPSRPVPLEHVALRWDADAPPLAIDGTELAARALFPLRTPEYPYDRYTAAIRYLEAPTLFENRPSYRLLDVIWDDSGRGDLSFGAAAYFDKLDVCETLGHEFAAAWLKRNDDPGQAPDIGWRHLPFRRMVGDPFDLAGRAVIPAITTLTLIRGVEGEATFLLHWRDPAKVATAGGLYDVVPAGEFQPASISAHDTANDLTCGATSSASTARSSSACPSMMAAAASPSTMSAGPSTVAWDALAPPAPCGLSASAWGSTRSPWRRQSPPS